LKFHIEADDPFPNIEKVDFSVLFRWGGADQQIIAAAFPREKIGARPRISDLAAISPERRGAIGCELNQDEVLVASDAMRVPDFVDLLGLDQFQKNWQDKWYLHGRRALNVKSGEGIGFVIEQQ